MRIITAESKTGDIVTKSSYLQSVLVTSLNTCGECIELIVAKDPNRSYCHGIEGARTIAVH